MSTQKGFFKKTHKLQYVILLSSFLVDMFVVTAHGIKHIVLYFHIVLCVLLFALRTLPTNERDVVRRDSAVCQKLLDLRVCPTCEPTLGPPRIPPTVLI